MEGTRTKSGTRRAGLYVLVGILLATYVVACSTLLSSPRQGWNPSLGPVVPHDTFPADCALCHEGSDWNKIRADFVFDHHAQTGVPLNGAHKEAACLRCHNDRGSAKTATALGCVGCHQDVHMGQLGPTCADCHDETSWVPKEMVLRHNRTRFPLVGAHTATACFRCHPGAQVNNFAGADTSCVTCHTADLASATNPDHIAQGLIADCQRCHTPLGWTPARFNHPASFPLTASHAGRSCNDCHKGGKYAGLSTDCASCHMPKYQATTSPNHAAAGFSTSCAQCHTTTGWTGAAFNHTAAFALSGGHAGRSCNDCHKGGVFTGLSTDCASCHLPKYQATTNPNHAASGFPTDCKQCHTVNAWQGATFNHKASFPLTSGHAGRSCNDCHKGGAYTGLSTDCASCHLPKYQATTNPNHAAAGFSTGCTTCHTTSGWTGAAYKHTSAFPLSGGHAGRVCTDCHKAGVYTGLSADCVSCHLPKYQATKSPNHTASGFPTDCKQCHTTTTWLGAKFNHPATFPLTAGHGARACADCHKNGVYTGLSTDCASCHLAKYQATASPPHGAAGFPTDCKQCHGTTTWLGATFTHKASFPLTAGHAGRSCADCHKGGVFKGLPTDCATCHLPKYQATTKPNHAAAGFPIDCRQCHTTTAWLGATFTHKSSFPLTGGHAGRSCADCHKGGVFTGLSADCATCHLPKYQATKNPSHAAAGFPTDCKQCHSTTAWPGATFTHTVKFSLTGGHAGRTCNDCHKNSVYAGLPASCVSCHLAKFQATTNPNHTTAGFPTDCATCHSTTTWLGAKFSHTWFPITSGPHKVSCNQCHTTPGNYAAFSCTVCHTAATTNNKHSGVKGYTWVSQACYQCHPNGKH